MSGHRIVCEFTIDGLRPQPKRRPRFGKGRTYTDARTVDYEAQIAAHARRAMHGADPAQGRVSVIMILNQADARVCDIDNAAKAILDAMNGIVYRDDAQVDELRVIRSLRTVNQITVRVEEVRT